jgi:hypothetical protein
MEEPCVLEGWGAFRADRASDGECGTDGAPASVLEGLSESRRRRPCLTSLAFFNDAYPAPIQTHRGASSRRDGGETTQGLGGGTGKEGIEKGAGEPGRDNSGREPWAWVPSLELTTHFWESIPGPPTCETENKLRSQIASTHVPYLRLRFSTRFARRGLLFCDSEVWAEDTSTLFSTSRQLARVLNPR